MSTNAGPENFDGLQKILAIKRHEQPPPRYFNGFSTEVLKRLNQPVPETDSRWWQRLGLDFSPRPALAFALAVAATGLFLAGVIAFARSDKGGAMAFNPSSDPSAFLAHQATAGPPAGFTLDAPPGEISANNVADTNSSALPFGLVDPRQAPISARTRGN